ncbi:MAG: cytochrome d ubiquinol oxidase subunit II [Actinobacteria bacterium]|nr:MAG: cytochrome d ubiquinol oxidase subunit II [Actinomycetota bacterium]
MPADPKTKPAGPRPGTGGFLARLTELAWQALPAIGSAVGFVGFVAVVGAAIEWIRFHAAHLPATQAVLAVPRQELVTIGALALAVFVVGAVIAVLLVYLIDDRGETTVHAVWGIVLVGVVEMLVALFFVGVKDPFVVYPLLGAWLCVTGLVAAYAIGKVLRELRYRTELKAAGQRLFEARDQLETAADTLAAATAARDQTPSTPPGKAEAVQESWRQANLAFLLARRVWVRAVRAWEAVATTIASSGSLRGAREIEDRRARAEVGRLAEVSEPPSRFELEQLFGAAERVRAGVYKALWKRLRDQIATVRGVRRAWARVTLIVLALLAIAGVVIVAASPSVAWLAIMLGVVAVLAAMNMFVALATTKFAWYGVSVFFSVLLFGAALTIARTLNAPKVQPIALVRKSDDVGICGVYITQTSDRVYVGRVTAEGGRTGRIFWVRRDDVDVVSVGELQNIGDKFDGIATQMLMEVYKDRAEEPAPAVKGTTETQVVGSEVKAGSPGSQTTTVKEFPATKGRPTVRPSPQSPPPKCTNL